MPTLITLIKALFSRYYFTAAVIIFVATLVLTNTSLLRQREKTFANIPKGLLIQGEVISYPVLKSNQQSFIIRNSEPAVNVQVYIPREVKVTKGAIVSCQGSLIYTDLQYDISRNVLAIINGCAEFKTITVADGLQRALNKVRNLITDFCRENFPEPQASLLLGMLIGSDESFSENFDSSLLITGTKHIIAVSGFNVNFITGIFLLLSGLIERRKVITFIIPFLLIYLLLVGPDNIPAMRATIMNIYYLFGQLCGIKPSFLNSIGIALILIIFISPLSVLSISLYLSFFAVIGQGMLGPLMSNIIKSENVRTSLVCILGTLPVTIFAFNKFYPWALIANIIIAPLIPIIMEVSILSLPLSVLSGDLQYLLLAPLRSLLLVLTDIIQFGTKLPWGSFAVESPWNLILLVAITVILLVIHWINRKHEAAMAD